MKKMAIVIASLLGLAMAAPSQAADTSVVKDGPAVTVPAGGLGGFDRKPD